MAFFDSLIAWIIVIFCITVILFAIFVYILGWFYPEKEEIQIWKRLTVEETQQLTEHEKQELNDSERSRTRNKWIGFFVLLAMCVIVALTGADALMSDKTQ